MNKFLLTIFSALAAAGTAVAVQAQDIKGDAKAGEKKNAMCIGCHGIPGYQASFPEVYKVPMISGQNAKYIVSSLQAYAKGERKHPSMRAISGSLTDQDMADLAAFYETHGKGQAGMGSGAASVKGLELVKKGACASCHGENFNKPIDPSYPKIAGQHADFLFVALKSYKAENHATWGRNNAIMGGMVKQFTNAELKEIAGYLSALPAEVNTTPQSRFR